MNTILIAGQHLDPKRISSRLLLQLELEKGIVSFYIGSCRAHKAPSRFFYSLSMAGHGASVARLFSSVFLQLISQAANDRELPAIA